MYAMNTSRTVVMTMSCDFGSAYMPVCMHACTPQSILKRLRALRRAACYQ